MEKLREDLLDMVTGGTWNFNTLTPTELKEYNDLEKARIEAENIGDWGLANALEAQINAFIDRMDSIYGA